ncbi:hypothetical protein NC653_009904 [Populus alba x Populus x berolinensis]|uniref:Secreted protein n=1 Tax=Populus alba x Populus x berolinensis TaxID=444605 RepID=A0AAD6WC81_9ROSI|nr:hypothetical protein NC653_009904 [Populus alba x Populus x berolinensis]
MMQKIMDLMMLMSLTVSFDLQMSYRGYVFSDTSISIPGDEVNENMTLWSLSIFHIPCCCILLPDTKLCQPLFVCRIRFIVDAIPLVESRQNSFSW